ncbi:MAG TPA: hypothetical protein VF826_11795 [Chloroflexia bacterium]
MDTTPTSSDSTSYFGTTLRVTAEAVELRDRSYRLDSIRSARATRVRSNRLMLVFLVMFASFVVALIYYSLQMVLAGNIIIIGTDLGNAAALVCLAFNVAFVVGLAIFYRSTMKSWHFIYLARLQRKLWYTDIAASLHPGPITQVVAAVNQALEISRNEGAQAESTTLYYEEHSVRVDDSVISVDGQDYPAGRFTFVSMDPVNTLPWYLLGVSYSGGYFLLYLYTAVSPDGPGEFNFIAFAGFLTGVLLIALAAGRIIRHVNQDGGKPSGGTYECKLHNVNETVVAFASVDREYTKAAVDAINVVVRKQTAVSGKRSSTTRPSQRSVR